jgi:hypothetical protein
LLPPLPCQNLATNHARIDSDSGLNSEGNANGFRFDSPQTPPSTNAPPRSTIAPPPARDLRGAPSSSGTVGRVGRSIGRAGLTQPCLVSGSHSHLTWFHILPSPNTVSSMTVCPGYFGTQCRRMLAIFVKYVAPQPIALKNVVAEPFAQYI